MGLLPRALLVASLLVAPRAARADCEVGGVASLERLRVRAPGHRIRTLAVTNLPVAVRPGRGERYRDVRVLAPLAFGARTDGRIPWAVPRPIAVAGGALWLTPEVEIEDVRERVRGDELVIRAQLDAGVWVERVHVPCDTIVVGHGEGRADPDWPHSPGPRWRMQNRRLWLLATPDDDAPAVRLEAPEGLRDPLTEIDRRSGWVRVMTRFASGAVLRGWVRQHHLRAGDGPANRRRFARTTPPVHAPLCRRRDPRPGEYVGPAHITVGALVHMRAEGSVWATVTEPTVFTVSLRPGERWVRVVHVPGLLQSDGSCVEVVRHAYVERSMVRISGEGGRYDPMELLGLE